MKRKIEHITSIEIYAEIDKNAEEDENDAFEEFKKKYPNAYSPNEEYVVIYDDASGFHDIYRLL